MWQQIMAFFGHVLWQYTYSICQAWSQTYLQIWSTYPNCIILRQNDLVQDLGVFSEIMKYQNPINYISLIYIQFNCKTLTSNLENCKELYIQQGTFLAATYYHFHHLKYFRKSGQKVVTEIWCLFGTKIIHHNACLN